MIPQTISYYWLIVFVTALPFCAVANDLDVFDDYDCFSCHTLTEAGVGPSFLAIAQRYGGKDQQHYLSDKIINGGSGVWGNEMMIAHPTLSKPQARELVDIILSTQP
ncbi:c-type cytochrome [Oceanicoccus sp. KOV_DT_Chl]|uniref:c-type cytochrome n=1 Tax=Oceanicoccus sp. KOV_DT_Chl TaxID=1904639 RepID=UPI000C7C0394|nr:c-type cytochrome [Oceanicoccus sp. KOV_DT_Chl]